MKERQPPKKKGPGVTGAGQTGHCHLGAVGEGESDGARCASKCKETAGIFLLFQNSHYSMLLILGACENCSRPF